MIALTPGSLASITDGIRTIENIGKQVRFATAGALNQTAKDVQTFTVTGLLPGAFTLRSKGQPWQKPGGKFGFNIRPYANKDSLTTTLGSQADWLKLQEEGGTKTPESQHRLAIVAEARAQPTTVIHGALKPRALLRAAGANYKTRGGKGRTARQSGGGFILPSRKGDMIVTRLTKSKITIMYLLAYSAVIKPRLHFETKGAALANKLFPANFSRAFTRAIATAK